MKRLAGAAMLVAALTILVGQRALANRPGDLVVSQAWTRPTPPGAPTAVGYLVISNHGDTPDQLLGADSPDAASVTVHQMSMTGGIMRMRPVVGGLAIPAGGAVSLDPNGDHLMFEGLKRPFKTGETAPVVLHFQHAGAVRVALAVH